MPSGWGGGSGDDFRESFEEDDPPGWLGFVFAIPFFIGIGILLYQLFGAF